MKRNYSLSAKDVPFALKDSKKYSGKFFYVRLKNFEDSEKNSLPKFAFIASKKEFKKAVGRNFAKRRLRESASSFLKEFPIKIYLFFAQKNITEVSFEELNLEMEKFVRYLSYK